MKRDYTLDSLRGLFLVVMTIDHLGIAFSEYTVHNLGFVTAAEGFIFLSGLVAGLVFTGIRYKQDSVVLWQTSLKRVGKIYLSHITVLILIITLGMCSEPLLTGWKSTIPYFTDSLILSEPLKALGLGLFLLYQPAFLDILPMYCLFLLLTPKLIEWFVEGRARQIFAVSGLLWLAAQFGLLKLINAGLSQILPINLGFFDILAWQLLFVAGLYLGVYRYHRCSLDLLKSRIAVAGSLFLLSIFLMLRHGLFGQEILQQIEILTAKEHLALLRLINFGAIVFLIAAFYKHFGRLISWNWLTSLGQHSLQVYAYQVILIYLMAPLAPEVRLQPAFAGVVVTVACVISLTLPAWLHKKYREWRTTPRPVVLEASAQA